MRRLKNNDVNGKLSNKCFDQMQIQMYVCGYQICYFYVADVYFYNTNKVNLILVEFDKEYVRLRSVPPKQLTENIP
jgi:hypothetical protein